MYICEICGEKFEKWQQKANHVRWNHKSKQFYNDYKIKHANFCKENTNKKFGLLKKFDVVCETCGNKFQVEEREKQYPKKERYFCSVSCSCKYSSNINKKVKVKKIKEKRLKYIQEHNIGIKYDYICKNCNIDFQHKDKNRIFCSMKCRRDYDRKRMTDKRIYESLSSFKFSLSDFPDEFDFNLIKEHGWYQASNRGDNLTGVSRDHMYSVKKGFENNIPPYYISHPANCKLLIHTENFKKLDFCSITLDELVERVNNWNEKYGQ